MISGLKLTGLLVAGALCLPAASAADTPATTQQHPHKVHKDKKAELPPPLPSGPQGPVPQIPLDAIPAVAPQVSFQDGLLTIVAPNSTLGDILRGVRKHTSADIEIPATASERVVTRLGPGPARDVMAELLNGSHFNYVLLGSPTDANQLVRVVLVPKSASDAQADGADKSAAAPAAVADTDPDPQDDTADDSQDQTGIGAEPEPPAEQPAVKTPQQMLQDMQQRQLQMQQQGGQQPFPGRPGAVIPPQPPPPQQ